MATYWKGERKWEEQRERGEKRMRERKKGRSGGMEKSNKNSCADGRENVKERVREGYYKGKER